MSDAIVLEGVSYRPGKHFAIRDLSMHVPKGAIYGFLGPNGSGKTTTVRMLLGMQRADAGSITVLDHSIPRHAPAALARIGYVPERLHLYPMLTVRETIRHHAAYYQTWNETEAKRLQGVFSLRDDAPVGRLSKGEAGKLMMLLALAVDPELLVLDEPTDGLDPIIRRDVLSSLVEYVSSRNATVLISSHLVHELERICDHIGIVDNGRMVAELRMEEFRNGIRRIRLKSPPGHVTDTPFRLHARRPSLGREEEWIVQGWRDDLRSWFDVNRIEVREIAHLDLEECFVELLGSARTTTEAA